LVLGRQELVSGVSERLTAMGHEPTTRARPLSGAGIDFLVICCDGALAWGSYVAHQRLNGQLLPILVVGHESPCPRCDEALNGGADAWLPESPAPLFDSLLERTIRTLSRRASGPWVTECSGVRFEPGACTVWFGGHAIALRPKEYALLAYLASRAGSWVSEQVLRDEALEIQQKHETPVVRVHLSSLRKALGSFAAYVESRRGLGYRFLMPAAVTEPALDSSAGV
jgi:DNA-binding response OmpR family regulator